MASTSYLPPSHHFDAFASILRDFDAEASARAETGGADDQVALLLDDEAGIALRFADVLEEILQSRLSSSSSESSTEDEIGALSLEMSTWSLIHALYSDRLLPPPPSPTPEHLLSLNPYTPPLTLIQHIISQDPELAEWQTIHSHLMHPDPFRSPFVPVERKEGYMAQTAGMVRRRKKGIEGGGGPRNLVESLDPDAALREPGVRGGGELGADDSNHNLSLLPALFTYLRYGRAADCAVICRENDQSWRGASLVGGGAGWWIGGLDPKSASAGGDMDMDDDEEMEQFEIGNRNRALWKKIGRSVASNTKLPVYERALYGTLTGYLPAVLPVCRSWEDHVWAHINARIEARIDRRLAELGGFWAEEFGVAGPGDGEGEGAKREGLQDLFNQVLKTERDSVALAARNPYRTAMMHVILGRTDELFDQFADSLTVMRESMSPELYPPLLRFFTHLILYLRLLRQAPPIDAANAILQAYLDVLEEEGKSELVAVYAASLGERNGAESYARFLKSLDPRTSTDERKIALERAKEHGLDLVEVAKLTVNLIMHDTHMSRPALNDPEPDVTAYATSLVEGSPDWILVRSFEWLTSSSETYPEALIQANDLVRYFLSSGKIQAAKDVLSLLPREALIEAEAHPELADNAFEYVQHAMLFEALEDLTRAVEVANDQPVGAKLKLELMDWTKNLSARVNKACTTTLDLLRSDWLRLDTEDERRAIDLARIRHIFVPELIFRLHSLLFTTREVIPGNLKRALEIPNLLADERYKLYVEFVQSYHNRLPAYLSLVRETSLECLSDPDDSQRKGGIDPFFAPSS